MPYGQVIIMIYVITCQALVKLLSGWCQDSIVTLPYNTHSSKDSGEDTRDVCYR